MHKVYNGLLKTWLNRFYCNTSFYNDIYRNLHYCRLYSKLFFASLDCTTAVGMEDGRIKDSQITASSTYNKHRPIFGRLHNRTNKNKKTWGAWCSNDNGPNEYLQVRIPIMSTYNYIIYVQYNSL